jgi:hypothetical protein
MHYVHYFSRLQACRSREKVDTFSLTKINARGNKRDLSVLCSSSRIGAAGTVHITEASL